MRDGSSGGWAREPHLSPEQLTSVHELNARFLDLACSRGEPSDTVHALGATCLLAAADAQRLASLSSVQRAAVAVCPYALFDLRFEDEAYWKSRLALTAYGVADEPLDGAVAEFVRVAVFYAWHVASTASLAAQFLLGMSPATVESFRTLSVNSLPALAVGEISSLSARWRYSAAYWSALIGAAARADSPALHRVQLHGLQLAAAARLP